jgi:nucleoside-diphosphate-sugar epimerase
MKILVIGGTGTLGSHLVPRLVLGGHDVSVVSRNPVPYYTNPDIGWSQVNWINVDRAEATASGDWAKLMAKIEVDVVMDLLCYTGEANSIIYEAFKGRVQHFINCGTIWAYGPSKHTPYEEHFPRKPICGYGQGKVDIETFLMAKYREEGFPATVIHPGHICARKVLPIDPQGSRDGVGVYEKLATGKPVHLPDLGLATLCHVHGDDVAQMFELAMNHREQAVGESFSAVAPYAMSLLELTRFVAGIFGKEPNLAFVPLDDLAQHVSEQSFGIIREHVTMSLCVSIEKAKRLLGYAPRFTTEQIFVEAIDYLLESGTLKVG